jgi:putative ABC transport system substrate-binding protein
VLGAGAAIELTFAAWAQAAEVPVIGFLNPSSPMELAPRVEAFRRGLAEAGYTEGKNVSVEFRWAEGRYERLAALAADLVRRRVAVIVASGGSRSVLAAKGVTSSIPIVFTLGNDAVALGLVASLNRPGGNVTGVNVLAQELVAKRLEVLHEAVPRAMTIALLENPDNPVAEPEARAGAEAAQRLHLHLNVLSARNEEEINQAFSAIVETRTDALIIGTDIFYEYRRTQLAALAAQHMLPTMSSNREFVVAGGFASYGANFNDAYRQAGIYAGRILDGTKPGDLPILQPDSVELVINMKTAKALGLTIPQSLLLRADELIQ